MGEGALGAIGTREKDESAKVGPREKKRMCATSQVK